MESETQLIANKAANKDDWKRKKIEKISLMLMLRSWRRGAWLMLNARKTYLQKVILAVCLR